MIKHEIVITQESFNKSIDEILYEDKESVLKILEHLRGVLGRVENFAFHINSGDNTAAFKELEMAHKTLGEIGWIMDAAVFGQEYANNAIGRV